ncbi:MAG: hypothetical protein M3540_13695, partial [Actinomycetota bacterium]|nr:hypothetical protein [Actinomycetota bacterium]
STLSLALAAIVGILGGVVAGGMLLTKPNRPAPAALAAAASQSFPEPGVRDAAERYGPEASGPGLYPLQTAVALPLFESVRSSASDFASALIPFSLTQIPGAESASTGVWLPLGEPTTTPSPSPPDPASPPPPLAISDVQAVSVTAFSATISWKTSEPVSSRAAYGIETPTLWTPPAAPSTDHVATLTGLSFDTNYRVSLDAAAADGRRVSAPFLMTTPGLPAGATMVADADVLRVDGQPFFPTIVWNACADRYPIQLAAGIDLFMGNGCGTGEEQLQRLHGRALSITAADGPGVDGSGLAGTFLPDEWDLHLPGTLSSAEAADLSTTSSPGLPRWLTLTNHFYSHASPLPQGKGLYPALVANAEVLGFDLYPLQSWCRWDSFGDVFASQQELVRLAHGKPTFQWIEARKMDCADPRLEPTPETVRAETWLAIAGGAHGIGYFPHDWSPEIAAEIAQEKREIETLLPALTQPALAANAAGSIRVGARELNGAVYVIAVNASRTPTTGTIAVPALGDRSLVTLDGARAIASSAGSFSDTFGPLEVRVYVSSPPTL